jgi:hypothetical protein
MGTISGRAELVGFAARRAAERAEGLHSIVQHVTTGLVLSGDSERVDAVSYIQRFAKRKDGSGFDILTVGFYADVIRKVGGAWLFESRQLVSDTPRPGTLPALRPKSD